MVEEIVKEEPPRVWIFVGASALSPSQPMEDLELLEVI
jgi:hypothetical protein